MVLQTEELIHNQDYEIPNLQRDKISQIIIWVVDDIEGPDIDSCGINSVKTLETRLETLGYDVTCNDNDKSAPAAQRGPVSSDSGGSWNKLMFVSFAGFLFRFASVY
ncbi:hypothetical protein TURU_028621 [Turdus rufiventris]|nr:hypothetical protein TURU_028621 [Turdus rufiventris]